MELPIGNLRPEDLQGITALDDPRIDAVIMTGYFGLLGARDEKVRLGALHDLADIRGHFARAHAKEAAKVALFTERLMDSPDKRAALLEGLRALGAKAVEVEVEIQAQTAEAPSLAGALR